MFLADGCTVTVTTRQLTSLSLRRVNSDWIMASSKLVAIADMQPKS